MRKKNKEERVCSRKIKSDVSINVYIYIYIITSDLRSEVCIEIFRLYFYHLCPPLFLPPSNLPPSHLSTIVGE